MTRGRNIVLASAVVAMGVALVLIEGLLILAPQLVGAVAR